MKHSTEYTVADIDMLLGTIHELEATVTLLRAECEAWRREYTVYCDLLNTSAPRDITRLEVARDKATKERNDAVAATDAAGALRGEG